MALLSGGKNNTAAIKSVDRTNFVATAGQTVFTLTQGYSVGDVDVFLNGIKLVDSDDYTAINGTTVVLTSGAAIGDYLQVVSYNQFNAANTYTKTEADARYMVATGQTPMTSYLRTPNYGISSWSDSANASLEASNGAGTSGVGIKAWGRSVATFGGDIHYIADTRGAGGNQRFYGWNGTTWIENMKIDPNGRVTMPNQLHISGSPYGVASGIQTAFSVRTARGLSWSTDRINIPVSGVYMLTWQHIQSSNTGRYDSNIRINGTDITNGLNEDNGTGYHQRTHSISAYLSAGDYIQYYSANLYDPSNSTYNAWRSASVTLLG